MALIDDYILGNSILHDRFRLATGILGILGSHAPRALTIAQLEEKTGRTTKEIAKLCGYLWRAMLIRPDTVAREGWVLTNPPNTVTLEDIFRCIVETQPEHSKLPMSPENQPCGSYDADLLVMQATMAINQSVLQNLRRFSLIRFS